ncbi:MAG: potassium-transporting ATPase subunit KdpC [Actinomycetota bacterium]|nr:potassium-transporting ATPase subunit KdpC [Actinomycetota bacterium]
MRLKVIWSAVRMVLLFVVVLGLGYNLLMVGIGEAVFPGRANGSMVTYHGRVVGSRLIGQQFTSPRFFEGRPSATTPPYNASSSAASNYGPTNPALLKEIRTNLAQVLKENPGVKASQVPPDLVESSASGLDPDISPAAAYLQVPRVARANHLPVREVRAVVARHITGRFLGLYGVPHVNVLELNLAVLKLVGHRLSDGRQRK